MFDVAWRDDLAALDDMMAATRRFRNTHEYRALLSFTSRLRGYSPYNCTLLYLQNPGVGYVATASHWRNAFHRWPKPGARPYVILRPGGPVMFVYDLSDTDGAPVPPEIERPFLTQGELNPDRYKRLKANCEHHGVAVVECDLGSLMAGAVFRASASDLEEYRSLGVRSHARYIVKINSKYPVEDKYSSLAHELGHLFCGHLGADRQAWWEPRGTDDETLREFEAESVSYLVCRRAGLLASSDRYLQSYDGGEDRKLPYYSLNAIMVAAGYIEEMGKSIWAKPRKTPRRF